MKKARRKHLTYMGEGSVPVICRYSCDPETWGTPKIESKAGVSAVLMQGQWVAFNWSATSELRKSQ